MHQALWLVPVLLTFVLFVVTSITLVPPEPEVNPITREVNLERTFTVKDYMAVAGPLALSAKGDAYTVHATGETVLRAEGLAPAANEHLWVLPLEETFALFVNGTRREDVRESAVPLAAAVDGLSCYLTYVNDNMRGYVKQMNLVDGELVETQTLERPTPCAMDLFGRSVSVAHRFMAISDSMSVHLYYRESMMSPWVRAKSLYPPNQTLFYGASVHMTKHACYISSPYETVESCEHAGLVYAHLRQRGSWSSAILLHSPDVRDGGRFGTKITSDEDGLVWILDDGGAHAFQGLTCVRSVRTLSKTHPLALGPHGLGTQKA